MWVMCLFFCGIPHVTYLHEKLVSLPHSAGLHSFFAHKIVCGPKITCTLDLA